jgi:hypothetical protein
MEKYINIVPVPQVTSKPKILRSNQVSISSTFYECFFADILSPKNYEAKLRKAAQITFL